MTRPAADASPIRPLDSRSRAVLATVPLNPGTLELHLECGHIVHRRVAFCPPTRVICTICPRERPSEESVPAAEGVLADQDGGVSV